MSAKRGKTVSEAEFRRMWMDPNLTCAQIGERLGISMGAASARAKRRGLPTRNRPFASPRNRKCDGPQVRAMWEGGVFVEAIAAHHGATPRTIYNAAKRGGWHRPRITAWNGLTVGQYHEARLRAAFAASAAETRAAMVLSEMVEVGRWPQGRAA